MVSPIQIAQVVCAIATTLGRQRVQLEPSAAVQVQGPRSILQQVMHYTARHCVIYVVVSHGNDTHWTGNELWAERPLVVVPAMTQKDILLVNKIVLSEPRQEVVLVCDVSTLARAWHALPWALDNRVVVLLIQGSKLEVWEAYRAGPDLEVITSRLIDLSGSQGGPTALQMTLLKQDPVYRRTNLKGLRLRCSALHFPPYSILTDNADGSVTVSGINGDVMLYLQQALNFTMECRRPCDGVWGSRNSSAGDWTGILGELHRGEADISPSPYVYSKDRAHAVHFSTVLYTSHTSLIIRRPTGTDGRTNYTNEFTAESWWTVLAVYLGSVLVMSLITRVSVLQSHGGPGYSFITTWKIFCNMGYGEEQPLSPAYRIWLLTLLLLILVLHVYYGAFLVAILAMEKIVIPFRDLEGLYAQRDRFSFGVTKDSFIESIFRLATSGVEQQLWRDIIDDNPANIRSSDATGIDSALSDGTQVIAIAYESFHSSARCHLIEVGRLFPYKVALPMRRFAAVNGVINVQLKKLLEGGLYHRVTQHWGDWTEACELSLAKPLGLMETYTAFIALLVGVAIAIAAAGFELLFKNRDYIRTYIRK